MAKLVVHRQAANYLKKLPKVQKEKIKNRLDVWKNIHWITQRLKIWSENGLATAEYVLEIYE